MFLDLTTNLEEIQGVEGHNKEIIIDSIIKIHIMRLSKEKLSAILNADITKKYLKIKKSKEGNL